MRDTRNYDASTGEGQKRLMAESMGHAHVPRRAVAIGGDSDHKCDPLGDGRFRMVPSGDVVDYAERCRRLSRVQNR